MLLPGHPAAAIDRDTFAPDQQLGNVPDNALVFTSKDCDFDKPIQLAEYIVGYGRGTVVTIGNALVLEGLAQCWKPPPLALSQSFFCQHKLLLTRLGYRRP